MILIKDVVLQTNEDPEFPWIMIHKNGIKAKWRYFVDALIDARHQYGDQLEPIVQLPNY